MPTAKGSDASARLRAALLCVAERHGRAAGGAGRTEQTMHTPTYLVTTPSQTPRPRPPPRPRPRPRPRPQQTIAGNGAGARGGGRSNYTPTPARTKRTSIFVHRRQPTTDHNTRTRTAHHQPALNPPPTNPNLPSRRPRYHRTTTTHDEQQLINKTHNTAPTHTHPFQIGFKGGTRCQKRSNNGTRATG